MNANRPDAARPWTRLTLIGGGAAVAIGVMALVGWVAGSERLMAFVPGRVPMAPSTAVLFVLFGGIALRDGRGRSLNRSGVRAAVAAATLAALALLVLSLMGVEPGIEHLWLDVTRRVAGVSVGHMSPATAAAFLLTGLATFLLARSTSPGGARIAFVLAAALSLLALTLVAGYTLSRPVLYRTGVIPPAPNTAVAFLLLGSGLLGSAARRVWTEEPEDGLDGPRVYRWLASVGAVAVIAVFAALLVQRRYEADFRARVEAQLLSVADFKVAQISEWREELLRDANAFYSNDVFAVLADRVLYEDDAVARAQLRDWLEPIVETFQYQRIALLDSTGVARLSLPEPGPISVMTQHSAVDALRVLRGGRVTLEGFHRDSPDGAVHMTVLVPIRSGDGPGLGVLAIRVDPDVYLYPTLMRWPAPSHTAETLLVRRDGDDVLFLNHLRFQDSAALSLRIPVSRGDLPAARAVLGEEGIVEGIDYRGESVLAAVRSVPGSPWKLVARMDVSEAYGPLRRTLAMTIAGIGLLLLGAAMAVALGWQRREKVYYRERVRSAQRHSTTLQSIGDSVIATDAHGSVELMNPVAETLTGWSAAEAQGRPLAEVFHIVNEETGERVDDPVAKVIRSGAIVGLANSTVLIARDGTRRPIANSAAPIQADGGGMTGAVLVFRDQTERRRARRELEAALQQAQLYLDVADVMIVVLDQEGRVEVLNRRGGEILGKDAGQVVGTNWFDEFIPYSIREDVRAVHRRIMAGDLEPVASFENRIVTADGRVRTIDWHNAVVQDETGQIVGTVSSGLDVTERREAEQAVRRSETRYRNLFDSIRDAILLTSTDRRITGCNQAFTELFGYKPEEVLGSPTRVLYESEDEFRRMGEELRAHRGESDFTMTIEYRTKSGETFVGETGAFHLTNSDGDVVGYVGLIRDLTKRLEAERARERSEALYTDLFERAPVGIFHTRSDGQALAVNQAMADILGFTDPEDVPEYYDDLGNQLYVRPERRAEFLRRLREEGAVENFRYEARRLAGHTIWIEMDARKVHEHPDGAFDIEGFSWDVTDRKQAEDRVRKQQEMLERTESIAHIGSWELDVESGEVTWSDELFRIAGWDPAEGAPPLGGNRDLFPEEEFELLSALLRQAIEKGESYDIETRILRRNGEIRHCRARGFAEQGPNGRVQKVYGFLEDITETREQEDREQQLRAQLAQAQKMEAVGRLAGGVAHDFNNMLSVILGHVDLAQDHLDPEEPLYADLEEVRRAGKNSADLVRQLLAFAREQVAAPRVIDLNGTVSSMLDMLRRLIGEDIELTWSPDDQTWPVNVDPGQINQILANLLVNSRDAIDGTGQITIKSSNLEVDEAYAEVHPDAAPGDYVALSVTDTGHGMEPDVMSRVFDPFFTTKDTAEGTGLGLASVYGIARQNGGFATVYSEPGHGSTFKIHFPRYEGTDQPDTGPQDTSPAEPAGGSETILVVEDQASVLNLVTKILERLGYDVLDASSPERAIEIAETHEGSMDLLITDVIMPGMNGRELADRILESRPETRILFMSGYAEDVIASRGVIAEGVHFLEKPFTGDTLSAKVREALGDDSA